MLYEHSASYTDGRGDFFTELTDAVRSNPVPAVLVGAGVLWLLAGGRNPLLGKAPRAVIGGVRHGVVGAAEGVHHAAQGVGKIVESGAQTVSRRVGEAMDQGAAAVRSAGESVSRIWSETPSDFSGSTSEPELSSPAMGERVRSTLSEVLDQQPLLLGALGLALGAGIAAAFPATEAETRLVGETSDAVKEHAAEVWETSKREGAEMASRALAGAKAEGLTPAAAGQVAREVVTRAAAVAERTVDGLSARVSGDTGQKSNGQGINDN